MIKDLSFRSGLIAALLALGAGGTISVYGDNAASSAVATISSTAPTAESASRPGPFAVRTYTSGIRVPGRTTFVSPMIYYPADGVAPYPGVVFIPGLNSVYLENPETFTQWGTLLASHGFVVMFINPANIGVNPDARSVALLEGLDSLAAENTRARSPLLGKLDAQRIAVMGHSFGGSGALYAANTMSDPRLKAAIGLSPVPNLNDPMYSNSRVPSLIMAGYRDPLVANTQSQYNSIPVATPKVHALFSYSAAFSTNGSNMHAIANTPLGTHTTDPVVARMGLSFLKVYLMNDVRYQRFLVKDPSIHTFSYNNP